LTEALRKSSYFLLQAATINCHIVIWLQGATVDCYIVIWLQGATVDCHTQALSFKNIQIKLQLQVSVKWD